MGLTSGPESGKAAHQGKPPIPPAWSPDLTAEESEKIFGKPKSEFESEYTDPFDDFGLDELNDELQKDYDAMFDQSQDEGSETDEDLAYKAWEEKLKAKIEAKEQAALGHADSWVKKTMETLAETKDSLLWALEDFADEFGQPFRAVKNKIRSATDKYKDSIVAKRMNREAARNIRDNEDLSEPRRQAIRKLSTMNAELEKRTPLWDGMELAPKIAARVDADKIENQQIDIIKDENGTIHVSFKLTEPYYRALRHNFASEQDSVIKYSGRNRYKKSEFVLSDALQKKTASGATIRVSTGEGQGDTIRSGLGLVDIALPGGVNWESAVTYVDRILANELGIAGGISEPEPQDEMAYKRARYAWQHKTEAPEGIETKLVREEVSPGYSTYVEKGKSQEYQQISSYAPIHYVISDGSLPAIIKAGGLLSTHERYRRGLFVEGMSSRGDLESGGADSVFTRVVSKDALAQRDQDITLSGREVYLVFDPALWERTDWYAYDSDRFGSVDPSIFKHRMKPEEILKSQKDEGYSSCNEQMFRNGISSSHIRGIACGSGEKAMEIYKSLVAEGITEINGKPLEEIITVVPGYSSFIGIAEGTPDASIETVAQILARVSKDGSPIDSKPNHLKSLLSDSEISSDEIIDI